MIDAIIYACLGMIIFASIVIAIMSAYELWKERNKEDDE